MMSNHISVTPYYVKLTYPGVYEVLSLHIWQVMADGQLGVCVEENLYDSYCLFQSGIYSGYGSVSVNK